MIDSVPLSIFNCQRTKNKDPDEDDEIGISESSGSTPIFLVEMSGFEPPTPCVQGRCSPAELHPHPNCEFRNADFEM